MKILEVLSEKVDDLEDKFIMQNGFQHLAEFAYIRSYPLVLDDEAHHQVNISEIYMAFRFMLGLLTTVIVNYHVYDFS